MLLDSARRLLARGERVSAAVSHERAADPLAEELAAAGLPVARWDDVRSPAALVRASRALRTKRPRILHVHLSWPHADPWLVAAARLAGVRSVVVTEHLLFPQDHFRDDLRKRALAPLVDRTIAVSTGIAEHLVNRWGYRMSRVTILPNGVDMRRFSGPDPELRARARQRLGFGDDVFLVGSAGRLETQKGFAHLVLAAARLTHHHPSLHVVIAGEGSLAGALRETATACGLGGRLRLAGPTAEMPEFLAALDLFVLPSLWEGMPLSLLEAMAMGVPSVATSTPGAIEILAGPERVGDTVPPRDVDALALSIAGHAQNRARSQAIGRAGLSRVRERHDAARLFERLVAIYDDLATPGAA